MKQKVNSRFYFIGFFLESLVDLEVLNQKLEKATPPIHKETAQGSDLK